MSGNDEAPRASDSVSDRDAGRRRPEGALSPGEIRDWLSGLEDPLEVEIGMGGGHFLVEYARRHPEVAFVGIEKKRHRVVRALKKLDAAGLPHARIAMGDANALLDILAPASVSAFHIYFLDPWPKSRHRRRRFLRGETVGLLLDRLTPGGRVLFATDMLDYFIQTKILFILRGAVWSDAEPPEEAHLSVYAARFRDSGTTTYFAAARKPTGSGSAAAAPGTG